MIDSALSNVVCSLAIFAARAYKTSFCWCLRDLSLQAPRRECIDLSSHMFSTAFAQGYNAAYANSDNLEKRNLIEKKKQKS